MGDFSEGIIRVIDKSADDVIKADVGSSPNSSLIQDISAIKQALYDAGGIPPPYEPAKMIRWVELSAALRPNIDAYSSAIHGFGHRLDPVIDMTTKQSDEQIADLLFNRTGSEPDAEAIAKERDKIRQDARREKARIEPLFERFCREKSFIDFRQNICFDMEATGNAYVEIVRDRVGRPSRMIHVPTVTMRIGTTDDQYIQADEIVRKSAIEYDIETVYRRFKKFIQVDPYSLAVTYFNEFGDTRVMSSKTGKRYTNEAALARAEPGVSKATEIAHFAIYWPGSVYGIPRWVAAWPEVAGSRATAEVNYMYFDNKAIPPLALLVSGGAIKQEAVNRIQDYVQKELTGRDNFHKILVVQASSDGTGSQCRMELKPLGEAIQQDALFQNYDARNISKIGASFRIPPILRGETKDFNRATADASIRFAEDQVFYTMRESFDWWINNRILPELDVRYWRFNSLTPTTKDPERLAAMIAKLSAASVLTPNDGRRIAQDVFNKTLPDIREAWGNQPVTLTLAGIQNGVGADGAPADAESETIDKEAKRMLGISARLQAAERKVVKRRASLMREQIKAGDMGDIADLVIEVPDDEWATWWEPMAGAADDNKGEPDR